MNELEQDIGARVKQAITAKQAWHFRIVPKDCTESTIEVYMDRSKYINGIGSELEVVTGKRVVINPVDGEIIEKSLNRHYPAASEEGRGSDIPRLIADKEGFILTMIEEAIEFGSSDIHFEVQEKQSRVRYRVDGNLVDKYEIPKIEYPAIVNALKIKANLDIAEKRLPQDGRIFFRRGAKRLDIRVSIIPTIHGEKIVLRLLNKDTENISIDHLGFSNSQLEDYRNGYMRSHGLVLISGPTGSGKTTTLYATLKKLNTKDKNILTIEDPIEYTLEGINQVQLKENIGLSFPVALRTFLRQDPDIIMVGEIRDEETAQIAIRSALTGHLVLSTIHTNSAWGIISRLVDMGVPEYLISATLNVAVAQRLVRLLCPKCKMTSNDMEAVERFLPGWSGESYEPVGCPACSYSGFRGRKAIFEVVGIDQEHCNNIKEGKTGPESLDTRETTHLLSDQAKGLFVQGETSFSEILPILLNN